MLDILNMTESCFKICVIVLKSGFNHKPGLYAFHIIIFFVSLQILQNDVSAHQPSVDSVNEAGKQVIVGEGGAQATSTREKLDLLNQKWEDVLAKTRDRQFELETALREVCSHL